MEQGAETDARPAQVLKAAFGVFAAQGFRRTSMEDIARAAEMSRPALYLHFRNKEDIYRSLVQSYFDAKCNAVIAALAGDMSPPVALKAAFRAMTGPVTEVLLSSDHGAELLDVGSTTGADVVADGQTRLHRAFEDWVIRAQAAGRVTPHQRPDLLAHVIVQAAFGLRVPPYDRYVAAMDQLADSLGRGIAAGSGATPLNG